MQYSNMEQYHIFYLKGLYSNGWKQVYAGDDAEAAKQARATARQNESILVLKCYYQGRLVQKFERQ